MSNEGSNLTWKCQIHGLQRQYHAFNTQKQSLLIEGMGWKCIFLSFLNKNMIFLCKKLSRFCKNVTKNCMSLSHFWLGNAKATSPNAYTWIKMQKCDFKTHKSGLKPQFSRHFSKNVLLQAKNVFKTSKLGHNFA